MRLAIICKLFILANLQDVASSSATNQLTKVTSCTCLGTESTYECRVHSSGGTTWLGSIFELCESDRIFLRHSQFTSGSTIQHVCNNGTQIVGRTVGFINSSYISQLTVTVSPALNHRTIQCYHDNGNTLDIIGSYQVALTNDPLPPPNDIVLYNVSVGELLFVWTQVSPSCPHKHYVVTASNCGICPNKVTSNSITCTNVIATSQMHMCTLIIQSVVCVSILGTASDPISIAIKVQELLNIVVIPEYSGETRLLKKIHVEFSEPEPFNISTEIDGSATSYTINYSDSISGVICGTTNIPTSSCTRRICKHTFDIAYTLCAPYSNIAVTTYATNPFGVGPISDAILIGAVNQFVSIEFSFVYKTTVKCKFINEIKNSIKNCRITYGPGEELCNNMMTYSNEGNPTTSSYVDIHLTHLSNITSNKYCYTLTASNGQANTVSVTGAFTTECNPGQLIPGYTESTSTDSSTNMWCGASFTPIDVDNGIVCYSGTYVGSIAFYFCFNCYYKNTSSIIRTCNEDGNWDGTSYNCDCNMADSTPGSEVIFGTSLTVMSTLTIAITILFAVVSAYLHRAKIHLMNELKRERESKLYEEIRQENIFLPMTTTDNVAYIPNTVQ